MNKKKEVKPISTDLLAKALKNTIIEERCKQKLEEYVEFWNHSPAFEDLVDLQIKAQGTNEEPIPLAIHPNYCQGYCEGFVLAKKIFKGE